MRKFLAVLMAVFMLAATLAVLPISAAEAVTTSNKDGSTAAMADDIDLVITEVLADTKSNNISLQTKNAYQYIEIYNRGDSTVNIYDYAIVRATYKEKDKQGAWPDPKKFDKKIVLDPGSIYAYYQENNVPNIGTYATSALNCVNADNGDIAPGQTALIWFWNDDTKSVISANGGTAGAEAQGLFNNFKNHYADMGTTIPEDVKIFATFGVDGIGQAFQLNVTANYVYALVKDNEGTNGFDVATEIAYSQSTGGNFTRNDKIVAMFKFGTSLGYYSTTENAGAIYTLASKVPQYNNKKNDNNDTNYFEAGKVDSFKEMGCIFFEEAMTPGKLLPIQWADLDPDRAPADVKGTDADWTAKVWAAYLAVALPDEEITNREEVDKNQSNIDVDRDDLGNQGQNKLGEWTYFQGEDGNYYRYKTEGGDKDSAVKVDKAEYDLYMEALAAAAAAEDEGLGIWLWVIIGAAVLVVLGAGAVVLIIVLKKKNKNVATDDVAGFVEIIDEEATAPAEEAAAPEAKTEE